MADSSNKKSLADSDEEKNEDVGTVGQIVQGEDGEYYVVVNDDGSAEGIEDLGNVRVVVGEDGSETLVLEEEQSVEKAERTSKDRQVDEHESENGDEPLAVGAMATAETGEEDPNTITVLEPIPAGLKMRRNRVYGTCRCPECGQSFVNTARLERHLAVHQVFGSYLCPLCGKTYKYEYNLFYHWRRTCRDLNELLAVDERKTMDVNALRQLVDEVAAKKVEMGPLEFNISRPVASSGLAGMARCGNACPECGVVVLAAHIDRHMAIHKGEVPVDARGVCGGFYCDLCGLMFRQHFNLIKHWRSSCPEIQAQLPSDVELTMDDDSLKRMVEDLLHRMQPNDDPFAMNAPLITKIKANDKKEDREEDKAAEEIEKHSDKSPRTAEANAEKQHDEQASSVDVSSVSKKTAAAAESSKTSSNNGLIEEHQSMIDEEWAAANGVVFADDMEEEQQEFIIREDGTLGPLGLPTAQARAKWSMMGGPVQCPECFRSFANAGRLERHLAGFHASFGTHHCILCGNRFKYDYNLLYHYRRSCPYTKSFIDRDVREQMDATSLRKLVRNLAQKEVRLTPSVQPPIRLPLLKNEEESPKPRLAMRYPSNQPPAHLLMPRPGLPEGKTCPVCGIIFYGSSAIDRHMRAAHPHEWTEWEAAGGLLTDEQQYMEEHNQMMAGQLPNDTVVDTNTEISAEEAAETESPTAEEPTEPPPTLTAEEPGEQVTPSFEELEEPQMDIDVVEDVQGLIDSGQLQIQEGDQIILVHDGDEDMHGLEEVEQTIENIKYLPSKQQRTSPRNLRNKIVDPVEVATILTEMKSDTGVAASKNSNKHKSDVPQVRGTVMTAEFEEELDVGSHSGAVNVSSTKKSRRSSGRNIPKEFDGANADNSVTRRSSRKAAGANLWKTKFVK